MYKVKGRVQKMLIFSNNLHEQPQKSFGLPGRIQFWWSEDGRGQENFGGKQLLLGCAI